MISSSSPSAISDLKELILTIIAVKSYITEYIVPENPYGYDITFLRNEVTRHNKEKYNSSDRNVGGSSSFYTKLDKLSIDGLYQLYNDIRKNDLGYGLRKTATFLTQKELSHNQLNDEDWQWRKIREYIFCSNFINNTFPHIHPFELSIEADTNVGKTFSDIRIFSEDNLNIRSCSITFLDKPVDPAPAMEIIHAEPDIPEVQPEVLSPNTDYIAHYLSLDSKSVIAYVRLKWNANDLVEAKFSQLTGFLNKSKPFNFTSSTGGIRSAYNKRSYSITLETDWTIESEPVAFLHISIENAPFRRTPLTGIFSSMISGTDDTPDESTSFGGGVILQPVTPGFDAVKFSRDLAEWDITSEAPEKDSELTYYQLVHDGWAIRYRLLSKLTTLSADVNGAPENSWADLRRYVGAYTCYYMRLSKRPVMFETSRIEIRPDGTCTLLQETNTVTPGYVKVHGTQLWFYFGYHLETEKEPIRFLVDDATIKYKKDKNRIEKLFGIFHSRTAEKSLVSGRMMMIPLTGKFEYLFTPHTELSRLDFDTDARDFFTGAKEPQTHFTDGPYWAEIANRISGNSAIDIIKDLGAKLENRFFYYTFKKDATDAEFIIERNIIDFLPNNVVKVHATNSTYTGTAYYHKSTLKLSLAEEKMGYGFLEIFLEYDIARTSEIKILHGISLWRSGSRLQGKSVVLSRYRLVEAGAPVSRFFSFTPNGRKELEAEDVNGGGVISHLRGESNRYLDISTKSSPLAFRPRDKTFREMHFLIACYYGNGFYRKLPEKMDNETIIAFCKHHLLQAYYHGYGCDFAELKIDPARAVEDKGLSYIESEYKKQFSETGITTKQLGEIKTRLRQIAKERLFMIAAFAEKGPLSNPEIREFAQDYWPWL